MPSAPACGAELQATYTAYFEPLLHPPARPEIAPKPSYSPGSIGHRLTGEARRRTSPARFCYQSGPRLRLRRPLKLGIVPARLPSTPQPPVFWGIAESVQFQLSAAGTARHAASYAVLLI